jgi:hypothetical protein
MARNWDNLSDPYRTRLQNNGVSRDDYENGVSLSEARGHGPSRSDLIQDIYAAKVELHAGARQFNAMRSLKNIAVDTDTGKARSTSDLRKIARAYDEGETYDEVWELLEADDLGDADKYH